MNRKRAVAGAVVVFVALISYRHFGAGPQKAYEAFAEEILHRRYDSAASMSAGLTVGELAALGSQERIGAGPQMFQTLFPSRFKIESEEDRPDGTVDLVAVQKVLFNPVGVESAVRPAMYADLRQKISLRKISGAWKITAFENKFERMDEFKMQ